MLLVLAISVVAAVAGVLRGGSLEQLSATKFRWAGLLAAGLGLQLLFDLWRPGWLTTSLALAFVLASNAIIAAFIFVNRRLPGMAAVAAGLFLNVVVIAANGAMPVSVEAAEVAGVGKGIAHESLKHEPMDADTALPWLGDVLPLPRLQEVFSLGDIVLALGIGWLVYCRTRPLRTAAPTPSEASG